MSNFDDDWPPLTHPQEGDGKPTRRRRMSLIECLVVIIIIGVTIGLLLPSLPRSRHPGYSNKLRCASNLRQMGLGISGYLNTYNHFPPGTIPNLDLPLERRLGWGITLLPYIDRAEALGDAGVKPDELATMACDDPRLAQIIAQRPGISRCPESLDRAGYIAIAGLGVDAPSLPTLHRRAGIFGDNRTVTDRDLKDGSSMTMMLVEAEPAVDNWLAGGRATVRGLDPARQPYLGEARQFGGIHDGGANVLFADGSVRFVRDSVNPRIFEGFSTIAGGEKVSADDLD